MLPTPHLVNHNYIVPDLPGSAEQVREARGMIEQQRVEMRLAIMQIKRQIAELKAAIRQIDRHLAPSA
ncbi:MAG TPA: hypothetical protein VHA37_01735 [Candidatus Saccharimonadales bacterium]|nr:hypothetical protein [Candidatus Saccharimonadales bacterium]